MYGLRPHRGSYYSSLIVFALLFLSLCSDVVIAENNETGYYMVSAAEVIFSNRYYGVVVGIFESSVSCSCEVILKGPRFYMSMQMQLTPMHPMSSYRFKLPELESGDYSLTVNGLRGINFTTTKTLTWQIFKNFVKIQTPKTKYWAGELLQFRVIFHNELMKIAIPEYKAKIWIEDAKGYRVRLYNEFPTIKGVFESELHIGRYPNIGAWHICVKNGVHTNEQCAQIQVEQFDPTFSETNSTLFKENRPRSLRPIKRRSRSRRSVSLENSYPVEVQKAKIRSHIPKRIKKNENLIELNFGAPTQTTETMKFQLDQKLSYAIAVVMFNGMVLGAGTSYPDKNNTFTIDLRVTTLMWPFVHVTLYGMESGSTSLYVATQTIKLKRGKHDHVNIMAPTVVKPGEVISLRVNAVGKSYMGLSAIDSGIFGLTNDNDFNEHYFDIIMGALLTFPHQVQLSENPKASNLGLFALTNAKNIFEVKPKNVNETSSFIPKSAFTKPADPAASRKKKGMRMRSATFQHIDSNITKTKPTTRKLNPSITLRRSPIDAYCCSLPPTNNDFNDVMLFESVEDTQPGWRNFTVHVPAKITEWKLNAFLMQPYTGLTLFQSKQPFISIEATKDLYLQYNLPRHIKVGELLVLPVHCFNQRPRKMNVVIKVKQNPEIFQQLDIKRRTFPASDYVEQNLQLARKSSNTLNLYIRALKAGTLRLSITAVSDALNDTVVHPIEIIQSGQLVTHHEDIYRKMGYRRMRTEFEIKLAHTPSANDVKCYLSANLIAANIQGLERIDRTDNGEQVISKLMGVYLLWDFVQDHNWMRKKWLRHLEDELNDGFQSMQRMRARDAGFSFDEKPEDNCTSVWLTGYALQMLQLLQKTPVTFDPRLIIQCENYLLNHRVNRQEFVEKCHTPERRKLSNLELSLDVLKGLQLSNRMIRIQESHSWVSKQLAKHANYQLEAKRGFNLQTWQKPNETTNGNWSEIRCNIEIAANILISEVTRKKDVTTEIYIWLISQLYGENCRVACFECSVARKAIYSYTSSLTSEPEVNLAVTIIGDNGERKNIRFDSSNKYQTQMVNIQPQSQALKFIAYGLGELLVQCSYQYDLKQQDDPDANVTNSYKIVVEQHKLKRISQSYLKICLERDNKNKDFYIGSEILLRLPSGYVLSRNSVDQLVANKLVLQADSKEGHTKLLVRLGQIQFNKLTCLSVLIVLQHKLEDLQPGTISISDTNSQLKPQVRNFNVKF
ncbi:thioester-containing protein 1 allele S1-like [Drosophila sulfurigaster albostrigata]|uniref:thioester-containing protein 1 allele S1-like n=1 Tax=Drosophila sulfurigaster albostrigata TaxID=89887 RepID=UPI002D21A62E|nr:thioester-containing protein 1 allele S1-like [Drosophila sulfurigaster albostrigata]